MRVLGIDPGVTGAWAVVEARADGGSRPILLGIGDLPVRTITMSKRVTRRLDPAATGELLDDIYEQWEIDRAVIERVSGAPDITSSSAFSLGWTGGTLDTLFAERGITYKAASPHVWKRTLRVRADKAVARRWETQRLRPTRAVRVP